MSFYWKMLIELKNNVFIKNFKRYVLTVYLTAMNIKSWLLTSLDICFFFCFIIFVPVVYRRYYKFKIFNVCLYSIQNKTWRIVPYILLINFNIFIWMNNVIVSWELTTSFFLLFFVIFYLCFNIYFFILSVAFKFKKIINLFSL